MNHLTIEDLALNLATEKEKQGQISIKMSELRNKLTEIEVIT